ARHRRPTRSRAGNRRRPAGKLAWARGHDGGAPQREQALSRPRRAPHHGPPLSELRVIPIEGLPEIRAGDDVAALIADAADFEKGDAARPTWRSASRALPR